MIVIPGWEMPDSCWSCPLHKQSLGRCSVLPFGVWDTWAVKDNERLPACPIYEVPEGARWVLERKHKSDPCQVRASFDDDGRFVGYE